MIRYFLCFVCLFGLLAGCAGSLPVMQQGALPQLPLLDLIGNVQGYKGQTVVVGGYVLEVKNQQNQSRIMAVQVPLGSGQRPKSRDLSEGRLILIYDGFIDPEVYKKDRAITVRGKILGGSDSDPDVPYPYLRVKVQDIYLWPEYRLSPQRRAPVYDPFYPWGYPWYPYWRNPYFWDPFWGPYWGNYWNFRYRH